MGREAEELGTTNPFLNEIQNRHETLHSNLCLSSELSPPDSLDKLDIAGTPQTVPLAAQTHLHFEPTAVNILFAECTAPDILEQVGKCPSVGLRSLCHTASTAAAETSHGDQHAKHNTTSNHESSHNLMESRQAGLAVDAVIFTTEPDLI
ncbi:hypothetical protein BLNAU_14503 [Blattamonas nauphoetae]|uniref:Uncharacterized protein n=1 Tax=Blattamonas nauphoetae TaxID=2049346 RepID=A0ABQ9XGG5_9EUKA|nr:hypothetical protein BLNAU_14503 [Blattamonas nauphoetae]